MGSCPSHSIVLPLLRTTAGEGGRRDRDGYALRGVILRQSSRSGRRQVGHRHYNNNINERNDNNHPTATASAAPSLGCYHSYPPNFGFSSGSGSGGINDDDDTCYDDEKTCYGRMSSSSDHSSSSAGLSVASSSSRMTMGEVELQEYFISPPPVKGKVKEEILNTFLKIHNSGGNSRLLVTKTESEIESFDEGDDDNEEMELEENGSFPSSLEEQSSFTSSATSSHLTLFTGTATATATAATAASPMIPHRLRFLKRGGRPSSSSSCLNSLASFIKPPKTTTTTTTTVLPNNHNHSETAMPSTATTATATATANSAMMTRKSHSRNSSGSNSNSRPHHFAGLLKPIPEHQLHALTPSASLEALIVG